MRIANMIDLIGKIAGSAVSVNQERCVLVRNRNADCLRCAEACVSGCISYGESELVISPFACVGCGTCCTVCPTGALEAKKPTDYELLLDCMNAAAANKGTVVILCDKLLEKAQHHVDLAKVVHVGCLGRLEESVFVALAADGVSEVVLCDALCKGCERCRGREVLDVVVDTTRTLLDVWRPSSEAQVAQTATTEALQEQSLSTFVEECSASIGVVKLTDSSCSGPDSRETQVDASDASFLLPDGSHSGSTSKHPQASQTGRVMNMRIVSKLPLSVRRSDEGFDAARRSALFAAKDEATGVAKTVTKSTIDDALGREDENARRGPTYIHVNEQGVLPHFVPDRRLRLIDALKRLGEPEDIMFDTRLWGNVIIDEDRCRSCYMCATFCPTGAMRKIVDEDGIARGIGHYPSLCVKCRTCEEICRTKAITISEEVFAVDMVQGMTERFDMQPQSSAYETRYGGRYDGFASR